MSDRFRVVSLFGDRQFSGLIGEVEALALAFELTLPFGDYRWRCVAVVPDGEDVPTFMVSAGRAHQVTPMGKTPKKPEYCINDLDTLANREAGSECSLPAPDRPRPLANVS